MAAPVDSRFSDKKGPPEIRKAEMADLPAIKAIVGRAICHMDSQGISQWDEVYPDDATLRDDIAKEHMFLITCSGSVAGFVTLNEEESPEYRDIDWNYGGRIVVVHRLTVDPPFQRSGLATALMDFAEERGQERGYQSVRLDAFTLNASAVALYEKRGYRKAGTVRFRKGEFFCFEKHLEPMQQPQLKKQRRKGDGG